MKNIEASVEALNLAMKTAREYVPVVLGALHKFKGEKVVKVTGGFTQKFLKEMPQLPSTPSVRVWLSTTSWSVKINISANVNSSSGWTEYAEKVVYVATLCGLGKIETVHDDCLSQYRQDFSVVEYNEINRKKAGLKKQIELLDSILSEYGF